MCGIAGIVVPRGSMSVRESLRAMANSIKHRGPDDEGYMTAPSRDGRYEVGLAHRRLAIIDLAAGHQPLTNEDGSVQIVFNGEIYNFEDLREELQAHGHVFRTRSDTETIVHAYEQWGLECVDRFRGMFAFAIWDSTLERLFLARDRFGKKPLYLAENDGQLSFGSEIKALLAIAGRRPEINRNAILDYLCYRYVPGPATLFAGIRKLEPGCIAVWQDGRLEEHRYYVPPDGRRRGDATVPDDVVGSFLDVLDDAVRMRMISDVPFGAFLSGGIDSSAVVALMSRHSGQAVKTFSVGFRESRFSELQYASAIARQFATEHHELTVTQDDIITHLPELVRFRDSPVSEPSDIPIYLLACEARKTVKMVLTGEGSDEVLGGYPKHVIERFARAYQRIPAVLRRGLLDPLASGMPYRFHRAKTAVSSLAIGDRRQRMLRWFGAMTPAEAAVLLAAGGEQPAPRPQVQFEVEPGNSALRSILYFDQTSWLPDNLLERGDRMTMAASIEARMPFMDHELIAFVSRLPDAWRVRRLTTKRLLREAMARLLPVEILNRPKVGFRVPVNEWFRGSMRDYLHEHLDGPSSHTRDYYRRDLLSRILDEHNTGRQNHEKLLWTLLSLEVWHRQYF